jgi:hypothetical protein
VQQPDRGGQEVQLGGFFFLRGEEGEKSMKEVRFDFASLMPHFFGALTGNQNEMSTRGKGMIID